MWLAEGDIGSLAGIDREVDEDGKGGNGKWAGLFECVGVKVKSKVRTSWVLM